jgi:hypothetical protein
MGQGLSPRTGRNLRLESVTIELPESLLATVLRAGFPNVTMADLKLGPRSQ